MPVTIRDHFPITEEGGGPDPQRFYTSTGFQDLAFSNELFTLLFKLQIHEPGAGGGNRTHKGVSSPTEFKSVLFSIFSTPAI